MSLSPYFKKINPPITNIAEYEAAFRSYRVRLEEHYCDIDMGDLLNDGEVLLEQCIFLIEKLRIKRIEYNQKLTALEKENEQLKQKNAAAQKTIDAQMLDTEIEQLKRKNGEEIERLKEKNETEVEQLKKKNEAEVEQLKKKNAVAEGEIESKAREITMLQTDLAEFRSNSAPAQSSANEASQGECNTKSSPLKRNAKGVDTPSSQPSAKHVKVEPDSRK